MLILGEGGADAPSGGQGRCSRAVRRNRPVSAGSPLPVPLTPEYGCGDRLHRLAGAPQPCRTGQVPGVSGRMPERSPECNAITPTGGTAQRTGAPWGRIGITRPWHLRNASEPRPGYVGTASGTPPAHVNDLRGLRQARRSAARRAPPRARGGRTTRRPLRTPARRPTFFGQLLVHARRLSFPIINTPTTCGSTMPNDAKGALRGPCGGRRTSQRAQRVKRFVIECFTPRCLVDLASDGELVTNAPPDTVDLIMGGLTGENMQDRGDDASIRGGLELHEPGVQFRYGGGQSVASTIGIASRHS